MKNELIRKELEKKFTHVTFVRTVFEGRAYEQTEWLVNEGMERITLRSEWKVEEILYYLELGRLVKLGVDTKSNKYSTFKYLMRNGKIPLDHTLYKKTTLKKLEKLL